MAEITINTDLDSIDGYSSISVYYTPTQIAIYGDEDDILSFGRVYLPTMIDMLSTEIARHDAAIAANANARFTGVQLRTIETDNGNSIGITLSVASSNVRFTFNGSGEAISIDHARNALTLLQQV